MDCVPESVVHLIVRRCGSGLGLDKRRKRGILKTMGSRRAFLSDKTRRITFHFTPRHVSWMNQTEIWFSILVRKAIRRGNFTSIRDLNSRITTSIAPFNETIAKPFTWTYQEKPLKA